MGYWSDLWYQTSISFCGVGLKSNQKVVGCLHNFHVVVAPICLSHDCYCSSQGSRLVRLLMTPPTPALDSTFQYYRAAQVIVKAELISLWDTSIQEARARES